MSQTRPARASTRKTTGAIAPTPAVEARASAAPIDIVSAKYVGAGWTVIKPPGGTINDLIAQKGGRVHFVQIMSEKTEGGARFNGLARNSFIQNAFSNGATPVYARLDGDKLTLRDINTDSRVVLGRATNLK